MVLSRKLVPLHKTSVITKPGLPDENEQKLIIRATHVTTILKSIQGYDHYGIND